VLGANDGMLHVFDSTTGKVVVSTMIPSTVACTYGGDGWVMEVDAVTGNRPEAAALDTNADGNVDTGDLLAYQAAQAYASGVRTGAVRAGSKSNEHLPQPGRGRLQPARHQSQRADRRQVWQLHLQPGRCQGRGLGDLYRCAVLVSRGI
jgi:Tfp pilus tip-associated adhesin PilY1